MTADASRRVDWTMVLADTLVLSRSNIVFSEPGGYVHAPDDLSYSARRSEIDRYGSRQHRSMSFEYAHRAASELLESWFYKKERP